MTVQIVAEISCSHDGSKSKALDLIHAAHDCGADMVKFQAYQPDTITLDGPAEYFTIRKSRWAGQTLHNLYTRAQTPRKWFPDLFEYARKLGITPFATPFCPDDVDFLETLDNPIYKVASFEITDTRLLRRINDTHKDVYVSTGMATLNEVAAALSEFHPARSVTLLHCVSEYPAGRPRLGNLSFFMRDMASDRLMTSMNYSSIGLSDHSDNMLTAPLAVAMGATVIERHIALDHDCLDGPAALTPDDFRHYVQSIRWAEQAVADTHMGPRDGELPWLRKGLWYARDLPAGHVLTEEDVLVRRPWHEGGLGANQRELAVGRVLQCDVLQSYPVRNLDLS